MTDDARRVHPAELTNEEWAQVEEMWQETNEVLDLALTCYRTDRANGTQPHPAVVTEGFSEGMLAMGLNELRALIHCAIHRIEVARLEKEAGL